MIRQIKSLKLMEEDQIGGGDDSCFGLYEGHELSSLEETLKNIESMPIKDVAHELGIIILDNDGALILDGKGPETIKKLKALEIIKEKGVDILLLKECKRCKTPNQYNKRTSYMYHTDLTQEEFDLLKEVLK